MIDTRTCSMCGRPIKLIWKVKNKGAFGSVIRVECDCGYKPISKPKPVPIVTSSVKEVEITALPKDKRKGITPGPTGSPRIKVKKKED